jgi:histidine triad (HIT) family protein
VSDCIFCRIAAKTIPSKIVYEDDQAVAFEDVNPQAPVHLLVIPRRHVASLDAAQEDAALLGHLLRTCAVVAGHKGLSQSGYRVVTNTGSDAGQTVFHIHLHVLGGRGMRWPPG